MRTVIGSILIVLGISMALGATDKPAPNPRVLLDPEPRAQLMGFGDSSVDLELRLWIDDPQQGRANVLSEVLLNVWDRFHEHGITIPFPQRDLHVKSVLGETEIAALRNADTTHEHSTLTRGDQDAEMDADSK